MASREVGASPSHYAQQREVQWLASRRHDAGPNYRLSHAEEGLIGTRRIRPLPVKSDLVQRCRLRIDVEDGIWTNGAGSRFYLRADSLKVKARAPRAVVRRHAVGVNTHPPVIVRIPAPHKRRAEAEAVLRRDAAHGDVQRMAEEENFRATGQRFKTEIGAIRFE